MNPLQKYHNVFALNKFFWNARTLIHLTSEFYDVLEIKKGKTRLNLIETNLLGEIVKRRIDPLGFSLKLAKPSILSNIHIDLNSKFSLVQFILLNYNSILIIDN